MIKYSIRTLIILLCLLIPALSNAAAITTWQIVPAGSSLKFTATQNNAPVTGEFKIYQGVIRFDPQQLSGSSVAITVDINSVNTAYGQLTSTLKSADWFDGKNFPQAVFKASHFTKTSSNAYKGTGTLTLRGKTVPVTVLFVLENYSKTNATVRGSALLKRMAFGVGQGEWAKTDEVKDEVTINFTLQAVSRAS